ncbi:MAG: hypothetical protein OXD31_04435 [Chloroflexi bacterium]|nr:hypothetical protein [Chloroflexota bacterium]
MPEHISVRTGRLFDDFTPINSSGAHGNLCHILDIKKCVCNFCAKTMEFVERLTE